LKFYIWESPAQGLSNTYFHEKYRVPVEAQPLLVRAQLGRMVRAQPELQTDQRWQVYKASKYKKEKEH
jgi:hypothetical protein